MRAILSCVLAVAVCGVLSADDKKDEKLDKIDPQKLIGLWRHEAKGKDDISATMEFTKDGKVTITISLKGETLKDEGTYKIDGAKVVMTLKDGGKERTDTFPIIKLTDTEMVGLESNGDKATFTRVKGK